MPVKCFRGPLRVNGMVDLIFCRKLFGIYTYPSDPGTGLPASGRTNYAACIGDAVHTSNLGRFFWDLTVTPDTEQDARAAMRGFFIPHKTMKFRDILDGLSNTIAAGRVATSTTSSSNSQLETVDFGGPV